VKRLIFAIILTAALTGGGMWLYLHPAGSAAPPADKPAADEDAGATGVSHDDQGNTVVNMDDDTQGDAGIVVGNPIAGQWSPEVKGYGRVLDPAPLVALVNELASAQTAAAASSLELTRQKTLSGQNNTSARALQAAVAAAEHDQLAVQSVKNSIRLGWGAAVAGRDDLAALTESLVALQAAIVRVDLPGGEILPAAPTQARLVTMSEKSAVVGFLSPAVAVDPQMQGQGYFFFVQTNSLSLTPGQALTAFLQMPGEPLDGIIIPRDAVVRAEGAGWVYVINKGGESFTRCKIPLDRATGDGWFVAGDIKPGDYLVVTGAQTLRSEELKAALSSD
jgi:hypothetical protein